MAAKAERFNAKTPRGKGAEDLAVGQPMIDYNGEGV
jgi:hypothetical protein